MDLYGILRRNGWASPEDLQAAAARSNEEGDKPDSGVRWIVRPDPAPVAG
jgi:hypothetical protein